MTSAGPVAERLPEDGQVVRDEEGRDRRGDDVGEHLRPAGEEGGELVERVAGEARGAAGLGVEDGRLDVGGGGEGEDHPGDHEGHRRQPERVERDQAERVVDRRADVPVGGREQRARAVDASQRRLAWVPLGHQGRESRPGADVLGSDLVRRRGSRAGPAPARPPRAGSRARRGRPARRRRRAPRAARGRRARRARRAPSAVTTSVPRRIPPSISTSQRPGDRVDHLGQDLERRRDPVELAPAVVGDDHRRRPVLDRERRVRARLHALEHDRQRAVGGERREVVPGRGVGSTSSNTSCDGDRPIRAERRGDRRRGDRRPGPRTRSGGRARAARRAARRRSARSPRSRTRPPRRSARR